MRANITRSARKLFRERSYGAVTVEDIARQAGISRATFYVYYEGKIAVLISIIETVKPELLNLCRELGPLADCSPDSFRAWFRRLAGFFREHHDLQQIWASAPMDPEFGGFLLDLGEELAASLRIPPPAMTLPGEPSHRRAQILAALFLSQLGHFSGLACLPGWMGDADAVDAMAELAYASARKLIEAEAAA